SPNESVQEDSEMELRTPGHFKREPAGVRRATCDIESKGIASLHVHTGDLVSTALEFDFMNTMLAVFGLGGWEVVLILAVVLSLFGAKKLPELAKGLGQGIKE